MSWPSVVAALARLRFGSIINPSRSALPARYWYQLGVSLNLKIAFVFLLLCVPPSPIESLTRLDSLTLFPPSNDQEQAIHTSHMSRSLQSVDHLQQHLNPNLPLIHVVYKEQEPYRSHSATCHVLGIMYTWYTIRYVRVTQISLANADDSLDRVDHIDRLWIRRSLDRVDHINQGCIRPARPPRWSSGFQYPRMLRALVLDFESHRDEILN